MKKITINVPVPERSDLGKLAKLVKKLPLPSKKLAKCFGLAAGVGLLGWLSFQKVEPDEIGLRTTFGAVNGLKEPGWYFQIPLVQWTHAYKTRQQTIQFNAGGFPFLPGFDSTEDQNPVKADIVLNYKIKPESEKLGFFRWGMHEWFTGRNGYWRLIGKMNESANAVLGDRTMAESYGNTTQLAQDFTNDLAFRINQNNMPITIESIEFKGLNTPSVIFKTRTRSYVKVDGDGTLENVGNNNTPNNTPAPR